jgi:hypothetical protein
MMAVQDLFDIRDLGGNTNTCGYHQDMAKVNNGIRGCHIDR